MSRPICIYPEGRRTAHPHRVAKARHMASSSASRLNCRLRRATAARSRSERYESACRMHSSGSTLAHAERGCVRRRRGAGRRRGKPEKSRIGAGRREPPCPALHLVRHHHHHRHHQLSRNRSDLRLGLGPDGSEVSNVRQDRPPTAATGWWSQFLSYPALFFLFWLDLVEVEVEVEE